MATTSKTLTYEEWLTLPEVEGVEEVVNGEIRKVQPTRIIMQTPSKIWLTCSGRSWIAVPFKWWLPLSGW
jgi:hypothetical protein